MKKEGTDEPPVTLGPLGWRWGGKQPPEPCTLPNLRSWYGSGGRVSRSRIKSLKSQAACSRLSSIRTFILPTSLMYESPSWWFMQWFLGARHYFNSKVLILMCVRKWTSTSNLWFQEYIPWIYFRIRLSKRSELR